MWVFDKTCELVFVVESRLRRETLNPKPETLDPKP